MNNPFSYIRRQSKLMRAKLEHRFDRQMQSTRSPRRRSRKNKKNYNQAGGEQITPAPIATSTTVFVHVILLIHNLRIRFTFFRRQWRQTLDFPFHVVSMPFCFAMVSVL
eukprot:TRINITY_DN20596_c0_g1_i1.p1 TRINITY_DN20596_c0_g1~~TRINITY_DN20596_c0_g1_i1.p1  ORF type:complete len:109 (-),score=4.93 TRINITY_DN20596_c0_g1_i1:104-430(-)